MEKEILVEVPDTDISSVTAGYEIKEPLAYEMKDDVRYELMKLSEAKDGSIDAIIRINNQSERSREYKFEYVLLNGIEYRMEEPEYDYFSMYGRCHMKLLPGTEEYGFFRIPQKREIREQFESFAGMIHPVETNLIGNSGLGDIRTFELIDDPDSDEDAEQVRICMELDDPIEYRGETDPEYIQSVLFENEDISVRASKLLCADKKVIVDMEFENRTNADEELFIQDCLINQKECAFMEYTGPIYMPFQDTLLLHANSTSRRLISFVADEKEPFTNLSFALGEIAGKQINFSYVDLSLRDDRENLRDRLDEISIEDCLIEHGAGRYKGEGKEPVLSEKAALPEDPAQYRAELEFHIPEEIAGEIKGMCAMIADHYQGDMKVTMGSHDFTGDYIFPFTRVDMAEKEDDLYTGVYSGLALTLENEKEKIIPTRETGSDLDTITLSLLDEKTELPGSMFQLTGFRRDTVDMTFSVLLDYPGNRAEIQNLTLISSDPESEVQDYSNWPVSGFDSMDVKNEVDELEIDEEAGTCRLTGYAFDKRIKNGDFAVLGDDPLQLELRPVRESAENPCVIYCITPMTGDMIMYGPYPIPEGEKN